MEKDVATILNYKDWQLVATHNENGEYGHLHHQMTHQIIEKEYKETGCKAELYWFGTYYVNDRIPYSLREMDQRTVHPQTETGNDLRKSAQYHP